MIKINTESQAYDIIANALATVIGFAGSALVGSFCNSIISTNTQDSSAVKKVWLKGGKLGLETITTYTVARKMREEIDDLAELFNDISGVASEYMAQKNEKKQAGLEIVKQ